MHHLLTYLAFFLLTTTLQAQSFPTTEQQILRAETLLDSARYDEALTLGLELKETINNSSENNPQLKNRYFNLLGNCYLDKQDYETAFQYFDTAISILRKNGDTTDLPFAQTLNNLGNFYFQISDFGPALNSHQLALDIRLQKLGKKHPDTADSFNNIANCYQVAGDYEQALAYYQQALNIRQDYWQTEHPDIASVLNNMGNSLLSMGDPQAAISYYQQALGMRKQLLGDQNLKTIGSYQSLGNAYLAARQLDSALFYTQFSLQAFQSHYPDQKASLAHLYNNLGNISTEQQNFEQAREYLDAALGIQKKLYGESHLSMADTYHNMGDAFYQNADYTQALLYFRRANAIYRQQLGANHPVMANVWDKIGLSLRYLRNYEPALNAHHLALNQRQDFFGPNHYYVAGTHINIGNCYWYEKKFQPALEYYQKGLAILEKQEAISPLEFNHLYNNIGNCYYEMRQFQTALAYYEKAAEFTPSKHIIPKVIYFKHLGMVYSQQDQFERAIKAFDQGLAFLKQKTNGLRAIAPIESLLLQHARARNLLQYFKIEKNIQVLTAANEAYGKAIDQLDQLWQGYLTADARQRLNDEYYQLFEGAIETSFELWQNSDSLHYLEKAFLLSEKSKSSRLLNAVRTNQAYVLANMPKQYSDQLRLLENRIALQEKKRFELSDQPNLVYEQILKIDSILLQLKAERNLLNERLRREFPAYRDLMSNQHLETISNIQKGLAKNGGNMLAFFEGTANIYAFVLEPKTAAAFKIPLDFSLESWLEQLGESIVLYPFAGSKESRKLDSIYTYYAHEIFHKIWEPLSLKPGPSNELIIIPDGLLSYLPFEVLLSEIPAKPQRYRSYPFLLKDFTISYAYSATLLAEAQTRPPSKARKKWLGMAPTFENNTLNLSPLDHNQSEVQSIQKLIGGDIFIGPNATLDHFLDNASEYRWLHLATHAMSHKDYGQYAFLAFSNTPDATNSEQLFANDLFHRYLPAELVVLSACETGFGNLDRSEGIASLARSFSYAGAKSVITTLWSVNDAKTAHFMKDFYQRLKKGLPKNQALWQSKQHYLENAAHEDAHPFYWATYLPIGDMGGIEKKVDWWIGLLVVLLGLRLFFYLKNR